MILKENVTHKAVKEADVIKMYLKGMPKDILCDDGTRVFSEETILDYPDWFQDEFLYSIPLANEDDLFAIFNHIEETNRINLAEAEEEFSYVG